MISFSKTIHVEPPQHEIFDFMADPANDSKWRNSAVSSEWISEGPVGSRLKRVDKFPGQKAKSESEVTAWEPPRRYGQKAFGESVTFELTVTLEPGGSGTRVTIEGQAELVRFFKIAEGWSGKQLEKQIDADFTGLKRVLKEGSA